MLLWLLYRAEALHVVHVVQVLQANVQRGSRVYEREHLLVLAWAEAQRDQEVIWKILSQVHLLRSCAA